MKQILSIAAGIVLVFSAACTAPSGKKTDPHTTPEQAAQDLLGSYQFSGGSPPNDVAISINVSRAGSNYALSLQAAHPDGHGAAPDGGGGGRVDADGVFRFTFEDSFFNRGTGTFQRSAGGYTLTIRIDNVREPRCLPFYGTFAMQRSNAAPAPAPTR